jgi:hypothetical protein
MAPTAHREGSSSTAWNLTRLAGSLLLELFQNGLQILLFLFRRRADRRRIRDLLLRPHEPLASTRRRPGLPRAAAVSCLALLLIAGCCGPGIYRAGGQQPGTSFSKEIDELVWSTVSFVRMPDWKDSLTDDLGEIVNDDPCDVLETFELWGW